MSNQQIVWKNGKQWLNQLVILHSALVIGVVAISLVIYSISEPVSGGYESSPIPASDIIGAVLAFGAIIASNFIYQSRLPKIQKEMGLENKLLQFRSSLIISYAILEFGCLANIVLAFISGNVFNLYIALVLAILFFLKRPTKEKVFKDLMLSKDEIRDFEQK